MATHTFFPQVNSNMIITQLPYSSTQEFESVYQDSLTGIRYSFPRRGVDIDDFPTDTLSKFQINYSNITDDEVDVLLAFFRDRRGRCLPFELFDPNGNLVQFSEKFDEEYWDKSIGPVSVGDPTTDPFGGDRATALTGGGANAYMAAIVGPDDGGINGVRLTASAWIKSPDAGARILIGFIDSTFSRLESTDFKLTPNVWQRVFHSDTTWDDNHFRVIIGGEAEWAAGRTMNVFGVQVVAMKGESMYVKTPGNYGYHVNCRFDTDVFEPRALGPNQNSLALPVVEFNG